MASSNPKGWNRLRVEYDNVGFFHGYYIRKGYTTLVRIPNWLGRILTKTDPKPTIEDHYTDENQGGRVTITQMKWRKYPDAMPDADGTYLVVVEYNMRDGTNIPSVTRASFTHDLAEACCWDSNFKGEHHPGWYYMQPDYCNGCYNIKVKDVVYWKPFPDLPDELKSMWGGQCNDSQRF